MSEGYTRTTGVAGSEGEPACIGPAADVNSALVPNSVKRQTAITLVISRSFNYSITALDGRSSQLRTAARRHELAAGECDAANP